MLHPVLIVFTLLCTDGRHEPLGHCIVGSHESRSSLSQLVIHGWLCDNMICGFHIVKKHDPWVSHCES